MRRGSQDSYAAGSLNIDDLEPDATRLRPTVSLCRSESELNMRQNLTHSAAPENSAGSGISAAGNGRERPAHAKIACDSAKWCLHIAGEIDALSLHWDAEHTGATGRLGKRRQLGGKFGAHEGLVS